MGKGNVAVPVSVRALVQRINRRLVADGRVLRSTRSARWRGEMGDYYMVDVARNALLETDLDLEALGRKLGALHQWERVAQD